MRQRLEENGRRRDVGALGRTGLWAGLLSGMLMVAGCGVFQGEAAPPPPAPPAEEVPAEPEEPAERPEPVDTVAPDPDSLAAARARERERERERERAEAARRAAEREAAERRAAEEAKRRAAARRAAASRAPVPVLPGAILPRERIVAFYGHANSTRMGILGELPPDQMLARLDQEVRRWEEADPSTPVRPALHLITTMATGDPGEDGNYRLRMPSSLIDRVLGWTQRRDAILFLDIQPGRADVEDELPRLEQWLKRPDVHLALDPEWDMPDDGVPGKQIGSMTAADVNAAVDFLARIVDEYDLPPKVLVVHRFTQHMLPNPEDIETDPRVQIVVNMDGWGPPAQKLQTYREIVAPGVYQWAGFKLFFKNDRRGGSRLLTPEELLALTPVPFYIQYQ